MQTFRAYLQDDTGVITWAAWIDAGHLGEATCKAQDLCRHATPTVEVWSVTDRRADPAWKLDPV